MRFRYDAFDSARIAIAAILEEQRSEICGHGAGLKAANGPAP